MKASEREKNGKKKEQLKRAKNTSRKQNSKNQNKMMPKIIKLTLSHYPPGHEAKQ